MIGIMGFLLATTVAGFLVTVVTAQVLRACFGVPLLATSRVLAAIATGLGAVFLAALSKVGDDEMGGMGLILAGFFCGLLCLGGWAAFLLFWQKGKRLPPDCEAGLGLSRCADVDPARR